MIYVRNRQTDEVRELEVLKTVRDLYQALNLPEGAVLVIRNGQLLTRDVRLKDGEMIDIIPVISGG
jgi:sulfur carrier protein ThiS